LRLKKPITLAEAADMLRCPFKGEANHLISGINEIHMVEPGDLVFVDFEKYYNKALESAATTILINKDVDCPPGKGLLISDDPFRDYNLLTRKYSEVPDWTAQQSTTAQIGASSLLHPSVSVGKNVTVGENCQIHAGVVLYEGVTIGNNVIIHANAVIGADAFYFKKREWGYDKMHSCGTVVIEDNVELGASTTIDRGVSGVTRVGAGSKLDNHVHVGHDTVIGKNCLFAAQVGIAGCVVIEDNVTLWGQVGVPSDLTIGKGAVFLGQSGVMGSMEGGKTYLGSPAVEVREKWREMANIKKLPDILDKLK
jgi:UDP-3-O-[3-hydroxymyristoyl] glucosamine N-acyltransferase